MNFFFRSRNFVHFIKNKKNTNIITNIKISNLKSRCLDKLEKRSYISISNTSASTITLSKSISFLSSSELTSIVPVNNTLLLSDNNDLNFLMNDNMVLENW